MKKFTDRDREVLECIEGFIKSHGYSPSLREISKTCYMSLASVQRHVCKLLDLGYIDITPKTPRSIVVKSLFRKSDTFV